MPDTPPSTPRVDSDEPRPALRPLFVHRRFRHKKAQIVRDIRSGGRVVKVPCPDGSIKLIGLGPADEWIAEWSCLEVDWVDSMIDRMARHVRKSNAVSIRNRFSII